MTHHLVSLGWTLMHFVWQAATIAVIYKVVDLSCAKARSHVRYLLALIAMFSTLAAAAVTMLYEETCVRPIVASVAFAARPSIPLFLRFVVANALPWIDALWMLGVLSLSIRTVGGWWLVQRLRNTALMQVPKEVVIRFRLLSQRVGIQGRVDLRLSARVSNPLAVGIVRSLVLLPVSALTALTPEQLEAVLAHELAHIRRADYFWNLLQTAIETLFFFHPVVWWLGKNLREQRELCCDDVAVECCSDPITYATALLRLEEQRSSHLDLAMALDGHQFLFGLRSRIARILGEDHYSSLKSPRYLAPLSLLALCGALVLFLLPLPQAYARIPHVRLRQIMPQLRAAFYGRHLTAARIRPDKRFQSRTGSTPQLRHEAVVRSAPQPHPNPSRHPTPHAGPNRHPDPHPDPHPQSQRPDGLLDI